MMNPNRPELLQALSELGELYPEWRFCQMVANMATLSNSGLWDLEDGELLMVIRAHIDYRRKALAGETATTTAMD